MDRLGKVKKIKRLSLYQKFALVIILAGILPIAFLSTVILDRVFHEHTLSLRENYVQGLRYAGYSLEKLFDGYNDISKFSYYYSYTSEGSFSYAYVNYDNLRQILTGENYPEGTKEQRTTQDMQAFLRNILKMDSGIEMAHFVYADPDNRLQSYHQGVFPNFISDSELFAEQMGLAEWDRESRQLAIIPAHPFSYVQNSLNRPAHVVTIARNYYDLKGMVGNEKYLGTLYVDLNIKEIESVFNGLNLYKTGTIYLSNAAGDCLYSSDPRYTGENLLALGLLPFAESEQGLQLHEELVPFGLRLDFVLDGPILDQNMISIQRLMYGVVIVAVILLSLASISFSRRLTKPMRHMMERMGDIETGYFEGSLPVSSNDEIGQLAARFNQMSAELRNYTNQVYVSKIKQTEAEMNALKSQIYPHFLFNTMEVIRMTAISGGDEVVAGMLEALGEQMQYLIGTVGDLVPLSDELIHIEKYIYLINYRYSDKISLIVNKYGADGCYVPKLILQPLVENAYIHGMKGKNKSGIIQLNATVQGKALEITVLDNGQGMQPEEFDRMQRILDSSEPGERTDSGWRSIGLKNVHDRLRYLYGEEYGVSLYSKPGVGTVIKLKLPVQIKPKEDTNVADDSGR